jgi:hypothetical protein
MNKKEAEDLVISIFNGINSSKSIIQLLILLNDEKIVAKKIDVNKYPQINFSILLAEIEELESKGMLLENKLNIQKIDFTKESTLTKILYSIIWKNGDLGKETHLIAGIKGDNKEDHSGLVFYQFGKHINDAKKKEPIIDQHTLRAFGVYCCLTNKIENIQNKIQIKNNKIALNIEYYLKLKTTSQKEIPLIEEYKNWIRSHILYQENEFIYILDNILFALGKTIKNIH